MNFIERAEPLVSVVIPYYQHKAFIERCLNSVWSQTYHNIQLIVVDDCSPDGSGELVKDLICHHNHQHWLAYPTQFHHFAANQGAHAAINYGISQADGSIITILNSDDVYHPDRIKRAVAAMQAKNAELVFSRVQFLDQEDADISPSHEVALRFSRLQEKINNFPTVGFACLTANVAITTGNLIFTKALYQKVGKFYDFKYCHDWDFLLRAVIHTEPAFLNENLYFYRFHSKNTFESVQSLAIQECHSLLCRYFSSVNYRKIPNSVAPSPLNWPKFFELFLELWKYTDLYKKAITEF